MHHLAIRCTPKFAARYCPPSRIGARHGCRRCRHRNSIAAVQARLDGYATSEDEVIQGVTSIAVPIAQPGQTPAALAVVFASSTVDSFEPIIEELKLAAQRVADKLSA